MTAHVDIQVACSDPVPDEDDLRRWIDLVMDQCAGNGAAEVSVRLVGEEEMTRLNRDFRGRNSATNVLSFPADLPPELGLTLLGDIVICAPVVLREAAEQGKDSRAHWAHMAVHGSLHLLGYDHVDDADAAVMESLETRILASLEYPCPYRDSMTESAAR